MPTAVLDWQHDGLIVQNGMPLPRDRKQKRVCAVFWNSKQWNREPSTT
jgi:hypothetical protein